MQLLALLFNYFVLFALGIGFLLKFCVHSLLAYRGNKGQDAATHCHFSAFRWGGVYRSLLGWGIFNLPLKIKQNRNRDNSMKWDRRGK
jgi:hypothetical protein